MCKTEQIIYTITNIYQSQNEAISDDVCAQTNDDTDKYHTIIADLLVTHCSAQIRSCGEKLIRKLRWTS